MPSPPKQRFSQNPMYAGRQPPMHHDPNGPPPPGYPQPPYGAPPPPGSQQYYPYPPPPYGYGPPPGQGPYAPPPYYPGHSPSNQYSPTASFPPAHYPPMGQPHQPASQDILETNDSPPKETLQEKPSKSNDVEEKVDVEKSTSKPNLQVEIEEKNTEKTTSSSSSSKPEKEQDDMVSKVSPMKSDFHFYAAAKKAAVLKEIHSNKEKKDALEAVSELNNRIMKMWEEEDKGSRQVYFAKEEDDRIRYIHEDEIESRHCATLTSRPTPRSDSKKNTPTSTDAAAGKKRSDAENGDSDGSPLKKSRDSDHVHSSY